MRYGNAFLGRLVESCLGRRASLPVSGVLAISAFISIPTYCVGVGRTLEASTSVPAWVWVSGLFVVSFSVVRRGSLNATLAVALAIGAVNLLLILSLSGLALAHLQTTNLLHAEVPFVHGRPFEASVVAVVFGVVMMAYFGHLSAIKCSSVVLERDPSGRSLIRGCAGAQATALALYCLFVVAANGAIGAGGLSGVGGTAIAPLGNVAGAGADILGSAFVLLALGLGPIIDSLTLFWLAQERLPSTAPRVVVLPRGRARLLFRARGIRGAIAYLGRSRFAVDLERQGRLAQFEVDGRGRCDVLPADESGRHRLTLEVLEADDRRARVAVTSTLRLGYEGELDVQGLDLAEVLDLSAAEGAVVAAIVRTGEADAATVAEGAGRGERETLATVERLVARGVVRERQTAAGRLYSARMAPRRRSRSDVWEALVDEPSSGGPSPAESHPAETWRSGLLGRRGRAAVSVAPAVAAFAVAEWFALTGSGSFAGLLSFLGVIVVSLLAGLLPVLLLVSSRRKGEYVPRRSLRFIGHPVLLGAIYVLFVGTLFAHGLVIWSNPVERACALAAGLAMLAVPVLLARSGAFNRRQTVELRDDQRAGEARIAVRSSEPRPWGAIRLQYADGREQDAESGVISSFGSLRRAVVALRGGEPREEVKVWAHRVTPEGESEALAATAVFRSDRVFDPVDLSLSRGEAVFQLTDGEGEVEIALRGEP